MFDHTLASLNQSYKIGTNHVENWLVKAVRERCDLLGIQCSLDAKPTRTPSLDLIKLAKELLSGCRKEIPPPRDVDMIVTLINNVISGRREAAQWHQQVTKDQRAHRADYAHNRFREVLAEVLEILQQTQTASMSMVKRVRAPKARRNTGSVSGQSGSSSSTQPRTSRRATVQSLPTPPAPESPTRLGSSPKQRTNSRDNPIPVIETYDPVAHEAVVSYLDECRQVRMFLQRMWRKVRSDAKIGDFVVAALVTNGGIAMITDSAMQLTARYPKFATFDQISSYCSQSSRLLCPGAYPGVPWPDLVCRPAQDLLGRIQRLHHGKEHDALLRIMEGHVLGMDIVTSLPELSKLRNDEKRCRDAFAGCDMFTRLIISFLLEPSILPISTVLALQIWMDAYDCLGREFESRRNTEFLASTALVLSTKAILLNHDETMALRKDGCLIGEQQHSRLRAGILSVVEKGVGCPLSVTKAVKLPGPLSNGTPKGKVSQVLSKLPGLSGYMGGVVCGMTHAEGVHVCNQGLLVHAIAHLYRAAQIASPDFFWDDLEFLIYHQRYDAFGLQAYQNSTDAASIYGRSLGVGLQRQKSKARRSLPSYKTCSASAIKLHGSSAYLSLSTQTDLDLSQPDQLAAACRGYAALSSSPARPADTVGVLERLEAGLTESEVYLHFDHHAFFQDCLRLMDLIMQGLDTVFFANLPSNAMFYQVVDELLWERGECLISGHTAHSFLEAVSTVKGNSSNAKHLSMAEDIAGGLDHGFGQSGPSAVQARVREKQAKAEELKEEQALAITEARAAKAKKQADAQEAKEAKYRSRIGQQCCPDCGRWFYDH